MYKECGLPSPTHNEGELSPVRIDLNKYVGLWFEQARIDSWFENADLMNVTAEYKKLTDSTFTVTNRGQQKNGKIQEVPGTARATDLPGFFLVSFIPMVEASYVVLGVLCSTDRASTAPYAVLGAPEPYDVAIVGNRDRSLIWLLTRDRYLSSQDKQEFMAYLNSVAEHNGYSKDKIAQIHPVLHTNS